MSKPTYPRKDSIGTRTGPRARIALERSYRARDAARAAEAAAPERDRPREEDRSRQNDPRAPFRGDKPERPARERGNYADRDPRRSQSDDRGRRNEGESSYRDSKTRSEGRGGERQDFRPSDRPRFDREAPRQSRDGRAPARPAREGSSWDDGQGFRSRPRREDESANRGGAPTRTGSPSRGESPYRGDKPRSDGRSEGGERRDFRPAGSDRRSEGDRSRFDRSAPRIDRDSRPPSSGNRPGEPDRPRFDLDRNESSPAHFAREEQKPRRTWSDSVPRSRDFTPRNTPHEARSRSEGQDSGYRSGEAPRPRRESASGARKPASSRPPKRVEVDPSVGVRVSKLMAERGLCSRREADEYIEHGWVFVNGRLMAELGARVAPDAEITLSPKAKLHQFERVTILLNKPIGYVSGQPEDDHLPAVSLIDHDSQYRPEGGLRFKPGHLKGLAPAGRLDIDSTGLLVLTQDGRVARTLIGEDSTVDKEYLVRVEGHLVEGGLELLNHGLELDGRPLRPAQVSWLNEDQLHFVLHEGRKRQIRRMCELVGLNVVGLKRVRIGKVRLGDLPLGQWRYLREDEHFD